MATAQVSWSRVAITDAFLGKAAKSGGSKAVDTSWNGSLVHVAVLAVTERVTRERHR